MEPDTKKELAALVGELLGTLKDASMDIGLSAISLPDPEMLKRIHLRTDAAVKKAEATLAKIATRELLS